MPAEAVSFVASDGRVLAGTLSAPDGLVVGAVVVFGALGVPHRYYDRFAGHLSGRGLAVLTFDYRGAGASRDRALRTDAACLLDWARLDTAAALDLVRTRWPSLPISGVGHSFGGQAFGIMDRGAELSRIVVIGAGSGDFGIYPRAVAWRYRVLLGVLMPVIGALFGYIPGRFGLGEDLPRGVVAQWARWCFTTDYVCGALGTAHTFYDRVYAPMLFVDLPDDDFAPPAASAALRGWFVNASVVHRVVHPGELVQKARGHFGVFREGGAPVWDELAGFLAAS